MSGKQLILLLCFALVSATEPQEASSARDDQRCLRLRQPNTTRTIEAQGNILKAGLDVPTAVPDRNFWPSPFPINKRPTGRVVVTYVLQPSGRADRCSVTQSSGHKNLDQASCRLVTQRLVADPAQKDGKRVAEARAMAFAWLPELNPSPQMAGCSDGGGAIPVSPGKWRPAQALKVKDHDENVFVQVHVSWTGVPTSCAVLASDLDAGTSDLVCKSVLAHGWFLPRADANGNLADTVAHMVVFLQGATSYRRYPASPK